MDGRPSETVQGHSHQGQNGCLPTPGLIGRKVPPTMASGSYYAATASGTMAADGGEIARNLPQRLHQDVKRNS